MKQNRLYIENLYLTDEYIIRNPSLHEEDSPWKITKIIPLVERFLRHIKKDELNLLDIGGGAGLILNAVSVYISQNHQKKVNKFALDLSPGLLEIQKKRNPDLKKVLNEDIRNTSLENKQIDLALMIDLLEHVPNPIEALEEAKRISDFVILKVPLEDNLHLRMLNFIKKGEIRQQAIKNFGHINFYNFRSLRNQIEKYTGQILDYYFTNVFDYFKNSEYYRDKMNVRDKVINFFASYIFRLSPKLCSVIFNDFVMILVRCY